MACWQMLLFPNAIDEEKINCLAQPDAKDARHRNLDKGGRGNPSNVGARGLYSK